MEKMKIYAPSVLRITMAVVIIWFGLQQLIDTANWLGYVPDYAVNLTHLSREAFVHINGIAELILGVLLLFGIWTRWVALLLALHLLDIMITVGYGEIGVRDFGLALATFTVFMYGSDTLSLDK